MLSLAGGNDRSFPFHRWLPSALAVRVGHHVLALLDGRGLLVVLAALVTCVQEHLEFRLGQEVLVVLEAQEDQLWLGLV